MNHWGDYNDLTFIAEEHFSLSFRARPPARLGITGEVLLKVLVQGASDAQWRSVAREIRLLQLLDSPHVTPLIEAGHNDGRLSYVLAYPALGTLARPNGALSPEHTRAALTDAVRGLAALHSEGALHRDFKPGAITLTPDGGQLGDFGVAEETSERAGRAVPTGSILFMAPELAAGEHADTASDIFSVGASLHLMLTGQHIRPAVPRHDLLAALSHIQTTPAQLSLTGLLGPLANVIGACLSNTPGDRPKTASEVADILAA